MPIRIEFGVIEKNPEVSHAATKRLWLSYELLPGPFPEQWAIAFTQEMSRKRLWHFNFGSLFVDEPYYRNKIFARLKALRQAQPKELSTTISDSDITPFVRRKVLEAILQECALVKSKNKGSSVSIADGLADLVRHYIQIYHPEFHFHISLQAYLPQSFHLPADAHSLFTCDRKDGWLYLDYIGKGHDSLTCYNEKSIVGHRPQSLFSANSQILYRDNFDGTTLKHQARQWLESHQEPYDSIGLIPLARPLHNYSRTQVREFFRLSDAPVEVKIFVDNKKVSCKEFSKNFSSTHSRAKGFFAGGKPQAVCHWLLRKTNLDLPVNFLVDWYHRYGISLWIVKQPYYWLKPRAFNVYFTLSWPVRKTYYFAKFQFQKRILKSKK